MANPWQMLDARETGANRTRTPKSGASSETVNQGPCEGLIGLLEPCAVKVASTVLRGGGDSDATPLPDHLQDRQGGPLKP